MNIRDNSVLENLNKIIIAERLNKTQILHLVNLVAISNNIKELRENFKWESPRSKY